MITTSTRSIPVAQDATTITRKCARLEALVKLFHVDNALDVFRELPENDPRRAPLLKFWGAKRTLLLAEVGDVQAGAA